MLLSARFRDWELGRGAGPTPLTDAEPVRLCLTYMCIFLVRSKQRRLIRDIGMSWIKDGTDGVDIVGKMMTIT